MSSDNKKEGVNKIGINWYPGHMAKTKRQIKEFIDLVDVVVHVIDARVPYSSFINDIDNFISGKPQILFMSKYDLCDIVETEKWVEFYKNKGFKVIVCNSKIGNDYLKVIDNVIDIMSEINKRRKEKGLLPKKANVLVVGASNVGKSTLINRLVNKKVSEVGNRPGITKTINKIKINDKIDLIDTPGVLWPKISDINVAFNLASMSIIKEEVIPLDEVAIYILKMLSDNYETIYRKMYGNILFNEKEMLEIYQNISKIRNVPFYQGEPDYERINSLIINDIKSERVKNITFDRI